MASDPTLFDVWLLSIFCIVNARVLVEKLVFRCLDSFLQGSSFPGLKRVIPGKGLCFTTWSVETKGVLVAASGNSLHATATNCPFLPPPSSSPAPVEAPRQLWTQNLCMQALPTSGDPLVTSNTLCGPSCTDLAYTKKVKRKQGADG